MNTTRGAVVALLAVGLALASVASAQTLSWASVLALIDTLRSTASALAVSVKQTALAAHQSSLTEQTAQRQLATAMGAISQSDRLMQAVTSFDSAVGQPVTIQCAAQRNSALFVAALAQRERDAARLMGSYASLRVDSRAAGEADVLDLHRRLYCTVSEARQGLCALSPNGMQGWDVNYAGAFSEKTLAPEGELAAYAYAAMVTDTRADARIDCATTACSAAQAEQLALAAVSAMAANSLIGQATDRRVPVLTGP